MRYNTNPLKVLPKHADVKTRAAIRAAIRSENMTFTQVAYALRIHPTHFSGMLNGSKNMAYHYIPALRYVLLVNRQNRINAARDKLSQGPDIDRLTPEIKI